MIDLRGVFDVGHVRRLVAVAETHQRLVRPGIVVEDRNFDDARLERGMVCRAAAASIPLISRSRSSGLMTSGSNLI